MNPANSRKLPMILIDVEVFHLSQKDERFDEANFLCYFQNIFVTDQSI